tara:strand:+ start:5694 stop:5906 length:213 start_codon:yes stop_codon:yes gene_type:complete
MIPVSEVVKAVGSQSALAKLLGVRQSHVWNWLNRPNSKGIPPQYVIQVEKATGISRQELRPDIFAEDGDQ